MSQQTMQPTMPASETNGLAVAGFVCSLVGLVATGGILCPVGLILSMVAMGRPGQRGLAVAGVILGVLGSCGIIAAIVGLIIGGAAFLAAIGLAAVLVLSETQSQEIAADMTRIAALVQEYEEANGVVPAELTLLDMDPAWERDPWGNRYQYHLIEEAPRFDLVSAGEDGQFGTPDDVSFANLGETWGTQGLFVNASEDGGTVTISLGDRSVTATGDEAGGVVTVDLGHRTIKIVGNDEGGSITVDDDATASPAPTDDGGATPADAPPAGDDAGR